MLHEVLYRLGYKLLTNQLKGVYQCFPMITLIDLLTFIRVSVYLCV